VRAGVDGSFAISIFAPGGTSILIKVDELGQYTAQPALNFAPLPAAIMRVPDPVYALGVGFGGAGKVDSADPPQFPIWTFQGTISSDTVTVGDPLRLQGTLRMVSPALQASLGTLSMRVGVSLEKLAGMDGNPAFAQSALSSTLLTPTGLPIERGAAPVGPIQELVVSLTKTLADRAEGVVDLTLALPSDLTGGYYRPYVRLSFTGVTPEPLVPRVAVPIDSIGMMPPNRAGGPIGMYLPMIRVGFPQAPHLPWQLLVDTPSNGTRGVAAREDVATSGIASRVLTQSEKYIVPRLDPGTGNPRTYRLEPFVPIVSVGDRGSVPNPPRIPFRFPSGGLTVRIERPNGVTDQLGPAPFVQSRSTGAVDPRDGKVIGNLTDAYQLTTLDPSFDYQFPTEGRFVITVTGSILDVWGNQWSGGGTYDVYVARTLSLDTAVLPGTPFEVGDVFNPGVVISPAAPAEMRIRFRMSPDSDPLRTTDRTISGIANRFGYFQAPSHGIALDQQGEYRVG